MKARHKWPRRQGFFPLPAASVTFAIGSPKDDSAAELPVMVRESEQ
jgi:hypothetical protein